MSNPTRILFVAGALDLSIASSSKKWSLAVEQLRLEFGSVVQVARNPSAQIELREGVRDCSLITSICAALDALARRGFRWRSFPFMALFYRTLLWRPTSLVVTIGAHPALCRVAKKSGVPIVELEHAPGGGSSLAGFKGAVAQDLPDAYIVFDDIALTVATDTVGKEIIVYRARDPSLKGFSRVEMPRRAGVRVALVALQWGKYVPSGKPPERGHGEIIPPAIKTAVKIKGSSVEWVLRPHPRQIYDKQYRWQMEEVLEFADSHDNVSVDFLHSSLDQIVSSFDVLVTFFSSSAFEAAKQGVPTILLEEQLREDKKHTVREMKFKALMSTGWATICNGGGKELVQAIHLSHRNHLSENRPPTIEDISPTISEIFQRIVEF